MRALTTLLMFIFLLMTGGCRYHTGPRTSADAVPELSMKAWEVKQPLVKVCATAPVTVQEVQWALDLWAEHGAPQLRAVSSYCLDMATDTDVVFVDVPQMWMASDWTPGTRGLTVTFSERKGAPTRLAVIGLGNGDRRVLAHEIGHIWVSGHYEGPDHVITPYMEDFAWAWDGVRRAFRKL